MAYLPSDPWQTAMKPTGECGWEGCTRPAQVTVTFSEPRERIGYCEEHGTRAEEFDSAEKLLRP